MSVIELADCTDTAEALARPRTRGAVILAAGALAAAGAAWFCVARTDVVVLGEGRVRPAGAVRTACATVAGRIVEVAFREGDEVRAGDALVRLDTGRLDAEIDAGRRMARAVEEEAIRLDALEELLDGQETIARARHARDLEEARSHVEREKARLRQAAAEARLRQVVLSGARERVERVGRLASDGVEPLQSVRDAAGTAREEEARVEAALCALKAARADVALAEERVATLAAREGAIGREFAMQREELRLRADGKRAALEAARERLVAWERDREESVVRAPAAGRVIEGEPRVGDWVEARTRVATIAEEAGLRVDVVVSAADAGSVRPGQRALLRFEGVEETLEGVVDFVPPDSRVEGGRAFLTARVRLPNPDARIRWGTTARVEIVVRQERWALARS